MTQIKNMPHSIGAFLKGVGVDSVELNANNHLIVHLDNGETVDAGEFKVDDELNATSARPLTNKALSSLFSAVNERISKLVGENATEAIDNLNEIIAFLQGFKDSKTLASTLVEINNAIAEVENNLQIKWTNKGYQYETMCFTETGEYDVPSGVNYMPGSSYIVQDDRLYKLEGKISLSGGVYVEKVNNKLVISGQKSFSPIHFVTVAKPILDILIPNTVLRKEDVLADIIADSTLPVQSDAIAKELQKKVDKVEGKGLSTNDYTDSEKAQVAKIEGKQDALTLTVKDNGNIVIGNIAGQSKEFMPATPSGDPMHYAYEAEGAVYDTTKGRWVLNGVEMTNDEMRTAYIQTRDFPYKMALADYRLGRSFSEVFRACAFKTNCGVAYSTANSFMYSINANWDNMFRNNELLVTLNPMCRDDYLFMVRGMKNAFSSCERLKNILSPIDVRLITTEDGFYSAFYGCKHLEDVKLKNLKVSVSFAFSPNITKDMLLYIIENSAATSKITITLHAEAYARLANDADILAALAAQPNISLISA